MASNTYNFKVNQGSDQTFHLRLKDSTGEIIQLSGYSARMQVRRAVWSANVVDDLSSFGDDSRISIDAENGRMSLRFPHSITETYPAASLVYDIEIKSESGEITRILQGKISVSAEVTRD